MQPLEWSNEKYPPVSILFGVGSKNGMVEFDFEGDAFQTCLSTLKKKGVMRKGMKLSY